jgi:hypothetical protein
VLPPFSATVPWVLRCTAQEGLQHGWEPRAAEQEVHLPQLVSQIAQQQQHPPIPLLDEAPRPKKKKDKKAAKWRRKAEKNRKKQQEAEKARMAHGMKKGPGGRGRY